MTCSAVEVIKVASFKLELTTAQEQTLTDWFGKLRWLWNDALSLLEESQQRKWREKNDCDPFDGREVWEFYRNPKQYSWQPDDYQNPAEGVYGLCCSISHYDRKRETAYPSCKLRQHYAVANPWKEAEHLATHQHYPKGHWAREIYPRFMGDMIRERLQKAWKAYTNPKHPGRRPKYKGKRDSVDSLGTCSGEVKEGFKVVGNQATIPGLSGKYGLGTFKAKGLARRWGTRQVRAYRICRKADGWYLQLTGMLPSTLKQAKLPTVAVGIDPGVTHALTLSNGTHYDAPRPYAKAKRTLAKMQRKAARQTIGGANWQKTQKRVAKLHGQIARTRRAWSHERTTYLAQTYGAIAYEANTYRNMSRRPKAKQRADGSYEQNGASRKAGLNKSLLDVAGGQLRELLKGKCAVTGSRFELATAKNNSRTCAQCGVVDANSRPDQAHFVCTSCGHSANADVNAAIVALNKVFTPNEFTLAIHCESQGVQCSETNGTRLSSRNRRGNALAKPASEGETPCQQEASDCESDPRSVQPRDYAAIPPPHHKGKQQAHARFARSSPQTHMQLCLWEAADET